MAYVRCGFRETGDTGKGGRAGGPPGGEPGRIHFAGATLKSLLISAYEVKDFQIVGPGWLGDERFIVEATMPRNTTQDQTRVRLRNLLAERFKVEIRRERRELAVYSMVVSKNGLKMPMTAAPRVKERGNSGVGTDGFPLVPADAVGVTFWVVNCQARINAQKARMGDLAGELEKHLGRPVMDATGLTGKFDFVLNFSPEGLNAPNGPLRGFARDTASDGDAREPLRDIFTVVQSEIGIKLEQRKGLVDMVVIDHAEKIPTGN